MKKLTSFLLLIIGLGSMAAQSYNKQFITQPNEVKISASVDTLKILAVMVDFQPDKYDATTGTGKFGSHYTHAYGDTILDPLPHDAGYFSDHLLFAKNYYEKVSGGKLKVVYTVLPEVITVSKMMREYSPGYNSSDLTPIARFSEEVWNLADQKFPKEVFSKYNLFVIFHAGVSSGLDLGTFSIDRNMPSVYLGLTSLKKMLGNSFTGFKTKSGNITNSIILPETESREQDLITGETYLNQVSINGAIVNNIGNHLGLPDLFNTETGLSAIGRFGMMDGQAISANYGMFPPEPSAWEKLYLGWVTPKLYSNNSLKVNITTKMVAAAQDTTLLKVPISSSEYFLVENRQQDALKNNIVLTIKKNGKIFTKTILPDTSGYFYVTPDTVRGGVVIDVDEFDASTPGNGIVIWHIDDKIINAKIADNKINNDPANKGVYVVEADGIQDVGNQYQSVFGTMIDDGTPQDFWFKGNKAKYYTNKFGTDTKPSTKSNSGASTFLTFENFTTLSNKMSFNISLVGGIVKKFKLPLSGGAKTLTQLSNGTANYLFVTDNSNLYKFSTSGEKLFSYNSFSDFKPAAIYYNNTEVVAGAIGNKINLYIKRGTEEFVRPISLGYNITAAPVITNNNGNPILFMGNAANELRTLPLKDFLNANFIGDDFKIGVAGSPIRQICVIDNLWFTLSATDLSPAVQNSYGIIYPPFFQVSATKNSSGIISAIILSGYNKITVVRDTKIYSTFTIKSAGSIKSFSLAEIDKSGENSILIFNGNKLEAYTLLGKLVEGFPIALGTQPFLRSPLTIDLDASKTFEAVSVNSDGNIYFANKSGKLNLFGESVNAGTSGNTLMTIFNSGQSSTIAALDESNNLSLWNFLSPAGAPGWTNIYGDETNSSSAVAVSNPVLVTEFFPANKAYNWPNPVYGTSTNIRYFVSENACVTIKIFDLSGSLVATLNSNAIGGMENETVWTTNSVQSGIYYANLEVNGSSGQTANKIIKIAVIK